jgi:tetratricopeptide (TPR) repeat protein
MNSFRLAVRPIFITLFLLFFHASINAQQNEVDSLYQALSTHINDSVRVKVLRNLSFYVYKHNPDSALKLSYQGLKLAKKIEYKVGISNCFEMLGLILTKTGNYTTALKYYIENLKIEEQLNSFEGIASVRNNIGIAYVYLEDYSSALSSFKKADSLVIHNNLTDLRFSVELNTGDVYEKLYKYDSAFLYYNQAMNVAIQTKNNYNMAKAKLAIANVYLKTNQYELALANYSSANASFLIEKDEDLMSEANIGLAKVYLKKQQNDSVLHYAWKTLKTAKEDKFLSRELDVSIFLSDFFAANKQADSAFYYLKVSNQLKDSLIGVEKLKVAQKIALDENVRQAEMVEKMLEEKETKRQQIQHILIGMIIPMLFFLTVLLSRIRIKVKVVRFLGIISLLFLFEYLTLILHPIVAEITHHSPLLEVLIFVAIASFLIPAHHKIEHWMIELLVNRVGKSNTIVANESEDKPLENNLAMVQPSTTTSQEQRSKDHVSGKKTNRHKHK